VNLRQPLALFFAFILGFAGTFNQNQERPKPVVIPAPPSQENCLPGYRPDLPCLTLPEIRQVMRDNPDKPTTAITI
jgi:hypothetical protein